jgi:integrase
MIGGLPTGTPVAFEAAFGWGWLVQLLEDYRFDPHLVRPLRCKAIASARLKGTRLEAYLALSLMTGIRTEEARALTWEHVDLDGDPAANPPMPPHVAVWRSVRAYGDMKTERSKRTLAMPEFDANVLRDHRARQAAERLRAGPR